VLILAPLLIVSVLVSVFLVCVYMDIARQAQSKKDVVLSKAFSAAKPRFLPLIWTYFLEMIAVLLVLAVMIVLFVLGGIAGIIIGIIAWFIVIFAVLIFFYEVPAAVVLENRSGIDAIKRSYRISKGNVWSLLAVIFVSGLINSSISSGLNNIPYLGFALVSIAGLFLGAWIIMMPAAFYYEYARKD
jgi:hypothetical protein